MSNLSNGDQMLTPAEVAERFRVTARTVYNWIHAGHIQAVKLGGVWRIPESALTSKSKREGDSN